MKYKNLQRGQIVIIKYHNDIYAEEFATVLLMGSNAGVEHAIPSNPRWKLYVISSDTPLYPPKRMVYLFEYDLESRITTIL